MFCGCHSPPLFLKSPTQFLLLRVHRDDWLSALQEIIRRRIDVFELRVAIRMRHPFARLAHRLQAIAQLSSAGAPLCSNSPAIGLLIQRRCELRPTLARPAQRRRRVAACQRANQCLQRRHDARLRLPRYADVPRLCARSLPPTAVPLWICCRPARIVSRDRPVASETSTSPP